MKKVKRLVALGLELFMAASVFTGCSNSGITLSNAFGKSQTVSSMQTQTEISLKVSTDNLSKEEQEMMATMLPMVNNSKISVLTKVNQNQEKTYSKVQEDFNMQFGPMPISMSVWADTDITGDKYVLNEIIKMPQSATAQLPNELKGKDYMVMNMDDMKSAPNTPQIDYKKLMSFSKEFQPKLLDFIGKYSKQFNPTMTYINRVGGSRFLKGDKMQQEEIYEVKLTDKSFKELMHYTLNNLAENTDAMSFIKDYMSAVMSVYVTTDTKAQSDQEAVQKVLNDFTTNLPQELATLNKTLDSLDNLKILGDDGITIKYTINDDGYIVNEKGNAQFVVDLPAIIKLSGNSALENNSTNNPTGIYTINLGFNSDITNINQNVDIVFPKLDATNSFNYTDLLKSISTQSTIKK